MRKRVVIDTDLGVDDALALLLALRSPELQVVAITTVTGNVPLDQATKNAALLLDLVNPDPRPILAKGSSQPLRKRPITAQSVHGSDGLGELNQFKNTDGSPRYPVTELSQDLPDAIEIVLDLLCRYPNELSLITLGPLTNLATALLVDKRRVKNLREVVVMGGAIKVPGNITPAAEFNIFVDPHAAQIVFQAGLPITLIPLDVTEKVGLREIDIKRLAQAMDQPMGIFISDATTRIIKYMKQERGTATMLLHDPLAIGAMIDPSLVSTSLLHVDVETTKGITEGMTLADLRPMRDDRKKQPNLQVALEVDAKRFLTFFMERLCPESW
jgi:inosine-uridine nucleoside N-ribohydrolase